MKSRDKDASLSEILIGSTLTFRSQATVPKISNATKGIKLSLNKNILMQSRLIMLCAITGSEVRNGKLMKKSPQFEWD